VHLGVGLLRRTRHAPDDLVYIWGSPALLVIIEHAGLECGSTAGQFAEINLLAQQNRALGL
jgi:hypothetical protein